MWILIGVLVVAASAVDPGMCINTSLPLLSDEPLLGAAAIDPARGFALFGTTTPASSKLVQVNLDPFSRIDPRTIPAGVDFIKGMAADPTQGYVVFVSNLGASRVTRLWLDTMTIEEPPLTSAPAGGDPWSPVPHYLYSITLDTTKHIAYAASWYRSSRMAVIDTNPLRNLNMSQVYSDAGDPSTFGRALLSNGTGFGIRACAVDMANDRVYFAQEDVSSTGKATIVILDLSVDDNPQTAPLIEISLDGSAVNGVTYTPSFFSLLVVNNHLFIGSVDAVLRLSLANAIDGIIQITEGEQIEVMVHDSTTDALIVGILDQPGYLIRAAVGTATPWSFTLIGSIELDPGLVDIGSGVIDVDGRFAYFGKMNSGLNTRVIKLSLDNKPCPSISEQTGCPQCFDGCSCGWCAETQECIHGDPRGAFEEGACPTPYSWEYLTCHNCSMHSECGDCTADPYCGWCHTAQGGVCERGGTQGSWLQASTCPTGSDDWDYDECYDCSVLPLCGTCVADRKCGYCLDDYSCRRGTGSDPFPIDGTCGNFDSTECPDCEVLDACGTCVDNPYCGWCAPNATCLIGGTTSVECLKPTDAGPIWDKGNCTDCSILTDCSDCTANPRCGWCAAEGTCQRGGSLGAYEDGLCAFPTAETSSKFDEYWSYDSCPACEDATDCESCAAAGSICGWCGLDGKCRRGGPSGAVPLTSDSVCAEGLALDSWDYGACPNCSLLLTCEACETMATCGWCGPLLACVRGSADGAYLAQNAEACESGESAWDYDVCPACADRNSCSKCGEDPECGWCARSDQCERGDVTGSWAVGGSPCSGGLYWDYGVCPSCGNHTTCSECTGDESCGWCAGTASCQRGNADLSFELSSMCAVDGSHDWDYDACHDCSQHTSQGCATCSADLACVWCGQPSGLSACMRGGVAGPHPHVSSSVAPGTDTCPAGEWDWSECRCASPSDCGACQAQPGCGWCSPEWGCQRGNANSSYDSVAQCSYGQLAADSEATPWELTSCHDCSLHSDCSSCATDPLCGWCAPDGTQGMCRRGNSDGVWNPDSVCFNGLATDWDFSTCAQCNATSCSDCLADVRCGWCGADAEQCQRGGVSRSYVVSVCAADGGGQWSHADDKGCPECQDRSGCAECMADDDTRCGYCPSTGTCAEGNAAGPHNGTCMLWDWPTCPCLKYDQQANCSACAMDAKCGWCEPDGQCQRGTSDGAYVGESQCVRGTADLTLPSVPWTFGVACHACASLHSDCESCRDDALCGWCLASSGTCERGGSSRSWETGSSCGADPGNAWLDLPTEDCPICSTHTTSTECLSDNLCGWCRNTALCTAGDASAPWAGECSGSDWVSPLAGHVDVCNTWDSCSSCKADLEDRCGWCPNGIDGFNCVPKAGSVCEAGDVGGLRYWTDGCPPDCSMYTTCGSCIKDDCSWCEEPSNNAPNCILPDASDFYCDTGSSANEGYSTSTCHADPVVSGDLPPEAIAGIVIGSVLVVLLLGGAILAVVWYLGSSKKAKEPKEAPMPARTPTPKKPVAAPEPVAPTEMETEEPTGVESVELLPADDEEVMMITTADTVESSVPMAVDEEAKQPDEHLLASPLMEDEDDYELIDHDLPEISAAPVAPPEEEVEAERPSEEVDYHGLAKVITDPTMELAVSLLRVEPASTEVALALVDVLEGSERGAALPLVQRAASAEVEAQDSPSQLFRFDSSASRTVSAWTQLQMKDWLVRHLHDHVKRVYDDPALFTFDVDTMSADEIATISGNVEELTRVLMKTLRHRGDDIPAEVKQALSHIAFVTDEKFPGQGDAAVGGILFLRVISPAIAQPQVFLGLPPPTPEQAQGLKTLAKVVQQISNGNAFKGQDAETLGSLDRFVSRQNVQLRKFYNEKLLTGSQLGHTRPTGPLLVPEAKREESLRKLHKAIARNMSSLREMLPDERIEEPEVVEERARTSYERLRATVSNVQGGDEKTGSEPIDLKKVDDLKELIYTPDLAAVLALLDVTQTEHADEIAQATITVFCATEEDDADHHHLLSEVLSRNISESNTPMAMLRPQATATRVAVHYAARMAGSWRHSILQPIVTQVLERPEANLTNVEGIQGVLDIATSLIESIRASLAGAPTPLREMCAVIWEANVQRFPDEPMRGVRNALSSFLGDALVDPRKHGLGAVPRNRRAVLRFISRLVGVTRIPADDCGEGSEGGARVAQWQSWVDAPMEEVARVLVAPVPEGLPQPPDGDKGPAHSVVEEALATMIRHLQTHINTTQYSYVFHFYTFYGLDDEEDVPKKKEKVVVSEAKTTTKLNKTYAKTARVMAKLG